MYKSFHPSRLVAIDHAKPSLAYARKVANDFGIRGIEYVYGDAANLLFDDNQFDFVTCRHSLQVFDQPALILKELYRICKPGGTAYITNEKNSHCLGEPRAESIQWTYNEVARLWAHFSMDIELGPKSRRFLLDAGFENIHMESFMCTNLDGGDPQDFADVIQAWQDAWLRRMTSMPISFRAKFILLVGAAVLFDPLLSGGVALFNVRRLSNDATTEIEAGLTKANQEYLRNYIETTALRADLLLG